MKYSSDRVGSACSIRTGMIVMALLTARSTSGGVVVIHWH
jgi:hypothetical protein